MENTKDREWSNHKWVTRERDKKGKWRYDYDRKKERKNENLKRYGHEIVEGVGEMAQGYKDRFTKNRNVKTLKGEEKVINSGRKFIKELFKSVI